MKVLLSGCSLSEWCGFGAPLPRDNLLPIGPIGNTKDPRCWYNLFAASIGCTLTNVSKSSYSNEEILYQTSKMLLLEKYQFDLVIIQTTSTGRKWFYRDRDPFESFSIGSDGQNQEERNVGNYIRVNLHNQLIEIERTLCALLWIQRSLREKTIPMLILNGMGFGQILRDLERNAEGFCRRFIPKNKWEIQGKIYTQQLADLVGMLDTSCCVSMDQSFTDLQTDLADDGAHPGTQSNRRYADLVLAHLPS